MANETKIPIPARIHNAAVGGHVAGTDDIIDDALDREQSEINQEVVGEDATSIKNRLDSIEAVFETSGGSAEITSNPNDIVVGGGKIPTANAVKGAINSVEALTGYYICESLADQTPKTLDIPGYIPGTLGGSIKVKMLNANTVNNAILRINQESSSRALYYNGARASKNNSWEAGEVVEIYLGKDGDNNDVYFANNVAGGSGSGDGAFDISAKTGDTYETLSAALTAANNILSANKKKGGMSLKFIQLTPATYTVVKTEGVEIQPTGTEVQEALSLESGTYTAAQMAGVTPPENGSVTYYLAVTVDETTTYTIWVITKTTNDVQKYVQYRYMESDATTTATFTNVANWQGVDEEPVIGSPNLAGSGGTYKQILEAVTYEGEDVSDLAGDWRNYGNSSYATVELDESGHNGTWHLLKKSIASAAIRMYCGNLINGKVYKLSFDCVVSTNVFISNIGMSLTTTSSRLGAFYDVYTGKPVGIETGHKELTFVKTSEWNYLCIYYNGNNLTFPIDVTISNFSLTEVIDVKDIVSKAVLFKSQALTEQEKKQARSNIGFGNGDIDDQPTAGSDNAVKSGGVVDLLNDKSMYCTPLIELPLYDKNISSTGEYSLGKHSFIRIHPSDTIIIKGSSNGSVNFAMTKSHNTDYIDLCDGTSVVSVGGYGNPNTVTLIAPEDAKYLLITRVVATVNRTKYIQAIVINGYDVVTSFYNNFSEFNDALSDVHEIVDDISNYLYGSNVEIQTILNNGTFWNSQSTVAALDNYSGYYSSEPIAIEDDTDYKIEIVTASSLKTNPILIVDENYTILKKYPRGSDHTSVTTFNIAKENLPTGSKFILLTGVSSTSYNTKVYKIKESVDDKISKLRQDVDDINLENEGRFDFTGKNIAIIGDSISTNGDWSVSNPLGNVPEIIVQTEDIGVELSAYVTSYDVGTVLGGHEIVSSDVENELTFTPTAEDVGKIIGKPYNRNAASYVVWWEVASEHLGFNPIPVAWSGSTITGDSVSSAIHISQIRKCGIRTPGTMTRTAPDMIIIYRGTNDFSHGTGTVLTKDYFEGDTVWTYPTTDVVDGGRGYLEGLCLLIKKLREAYPSAQIVLCTLNYFHRGDAGFPTRNSKGNTLMEYNRAIRDTANWLGCGVIDFDKDGITFENAASGGYYSDSDQSNPTHPNTKGHKVMGNRAIIDLLNINSMT